MQHNCFRSTVLLFSLLLGLLTAAPVLAQSQYVEGVHYERIDTPRETSTGDAVEVLEFFSYGCTHCNAFEPHLQAWKADLPEHVEFQPVPAGLGRATFQQLAAVYYIADELDVLDESHLAMFAEIHEKGNRRIITRDGLETFFGRFGVEPETLEQAMASPTVQERFAAGEAAAREVGLTGVPLVVVNGKYRVMRNQDVTSYEQLLDVVDYLVELEAGES